jgi:hypothetical protein
MKKTALEILKESQAIIGIRGSERNEQSGERSMETIVNLFNTLTNKDLSTSDGWKFMILLKLVRAEKGYKEDDYIDGASYFSLLGEERSKENV